MGGNKVGGNQAYLSEGSDGESYAAKRFGGADTQVRRLGDSDGEGFNV